MAKIKGKDKQAKAAKATDELARGLALSAFAYAPTELPDGYERPEDAFSPANFRAMRKLLKKRVKNSRYEHSVSVAKTARLLAETYGYDSRVARMAGLLHDWDKGLTNEHLRCRVRDFQLEVDEEVMAEMPYVLHGITAAAVLQEQFPELGEEVFSAVRNHTLGAPGMGTLDMIVYVADKIEPTHKVAVFRKLYKKIGKVSLKQLFLEVQRANLAYLIQQGRPLNVQSAQTWNWTVKEN